MDELEQNNDFLYEEVEPTSYAQVPSVNPTLTLLASADVGDAASVAQTMATMGPAYLASERAKLERNENVRLLKGAAMSLAQQGNTPALQAALAELNSPVVQPEQPSFHDDVATVAEATLERVMIQTGMSREEIIRNARLYRDNATTRTVLEVAVARLAERGPVAQFTQDVIGLTTVEDWSRLSPVVNEELEALGFQGTRAVTFATSVNNFMEVLSIIDAGDRGKVINTISERLVKAVGEKDTRRFLAAVNEGMVLNPSAEGVFGLLDAVTLAAIVKGGVRATLGASDAVKLAKDVGLSKQVATDAANKLMDDVSVLGITKEQANNAATTAKTLVPDETTGVASAVQKTLQERTEATIKDLELTLNSGGADPAEVAATKQRLERIYSSKNNPSIISSDVSVNSKTGKLDLDVLYGDSRGMPFATPEDALNYYKNIKAGDLEVVPIAGKAEDIKAQLDVTNSEINAALKDINEGKFAPRMSDSNDLKSMQQSPLFNYPKNISGEGKFEAGFIGRASEDTPNVEDVWQTIRANAKPQEQFVVDKLLKTLPKQTKVIIKEGDGVPYYTPSVNTMTLFAGGKNTNLFTHELIHAVTSSRIKYGLLNPSSELGKTVASMEKLREAVISSMSKLKGEDTALLRKDLEYLTKDIYEFSTAGLWSINQLPRVASYLNTVPYQGTTLLSKVWEQFKKILGFGDKDTALAEWFGLNENLSRQGLRVTLAENVTVGGRTYTEPNLLRVFPDNRKVVINETVDAALNKLEKGVAAKVKLLDALEAPPTGYYVRQKTNAPVFTDDIGKITQSELDKMNMFLGKLNPRLATPNSIYSPSLLSMYKGSKLEKLFSEFVTSSFDKLNKDQIDKVNEALLRTEVLKRDMSALELKAFNVVSDVEQEAYYAFRTMRNIQHYVKNKIAAESLRAQGYSEVFVGMGTTGKFDGPAKLLTIDDVAGRNVFDVENNKMVTVTPDKAKELDSRGLVIYRYAKGQNIEGRKGDITTIAVNPNQARVGDVISVVGKVDGAYARIYTEEFFIKVNAPREVDGVVEKYKYTFRTALTEDDAAKYTKGFNDLLAKRVEGGIKAITADDVVKALGKYESDPERLAFDINTGMFDAAKFEYNYTRIDDNYFRDITGIGGRESTADARLFWSGRSEEAIKSISTGSTSAEIKAPLESLEAEISNTARFVASNESRRNSIQRWFNTFEDVISDVDKANAKTAEEVFFNVVNRVSGYALTDRKAKEMLAIKDFILSQLGAKTMDERMLQHAIISITDKVNVPGFAHVGQWVRNTDVINWAKSTNSTFMLGLFAPAQLMVQSTGMLLAASISPKHGLKAAYSIRPILAALTSDKSTVWKYVHKIADVVTLTGMKSDEFARVAAAIKRTGLLDNIGASSVYNGADGATNIFARNKRKFNSAQMMFFNKGEEITRVGAFDIARREFIEANPGVKWDTDEALRSILLRSDDLTLNMSRNNEARITQGIFGIPLQFLQHNIRLGTTIASTLTATATGKKAMTLSTKEAFTLLLGSYLLYGVNNNATPDFIEEWLGEELNGSLSEEQKVYVTQGVLSGLVSTIGEAITGERTNIALGSRFSSIQWYEDLGDAVIGLFKGDKVDVAKLAGPTGSTLTAIMELPIIFRDYYNKDEFTLKDFGATVSASFGSLASSWRNVDKAYWAYHANGMVMNKRGDPQANLSWTELVWQALGFQSIEAWESAQVFSTNKQYASTMRKYADSIMRYEELARKAYLNNDMVGMESNYRAASAVLAPLPVADQKFIKRLINERTTYDTVGREAFNKWASGFSSHKNRLLVTNPYGEE